MVFILSVILQGKVAPNSYIYILPDRKGLFADAKGEFILELSKGEKTLIISHSSYKTETLNINLQRDTVLKVKMEQKVYVLPEILIPSDIYEFRKRAFEPYKINYDIIRESPNFLEPDPIRAISGLPGTKFASDLGMKISIMNSPPEETVYLLDGIRIFNPVHLGGLVSFLDVNQMSYAEFYEAPYTSDIYGLSGTANIRSINLLSARNRNFVDLSFISAKAGFTRNTGKYYISSSIRGLHLYYISLISGRELPYTFYDGFVKGGFKLGGIIFNVGALYSQGFFDYKNDSTGTYITSNWGNTLIYSSGEVGGFNIETFYASYETGIYSRLYGTGTTFTENPIGCYGFKISFDKGWLKLGYEGTKYNVFYKAIYENTQKYKEDIPYIGWSYIQIMHEGERLIPSVGIRTDGFYLDPTLSLKIFITESVAFRTLMALSTDYFYGFPMEGGGNIRFYYFMPSFYVFENLPQRAAFNIVEIARSTKRYSAFVRFVYKKYLRVYNDFIAVQGFGRGLSVGYTGRLLGGSASMWYSYFQREPKTFLDAPHNLRISYTFPFMGKKAGFSFSYHTGYPKDSSRYPDYHKLDVFVSGSLKLWKMNGHWNLTVVNVYNRKNVFLEYYSEKDRRVHTVPQLPLLPTLSISLVF